MTQNHELSAHQILMSGIRPDVESTDSRKMSKLNRLVQSNDDVCMKPKCGSNILLVL